MKAAPVALLCVLAPLSPACSENRPIVFGPDAGAVSQTGASGSGQSGSSGSAGASGTSGGTTPGTGTAGTGVTTAKGCDISQLVTTKYSCTLPGACHDAKRSATGLDMVAPGWEQKLVGSFASNGTDPNATPSECLGYPEPYLVAGSLPARGLFLEKLKPTFPCGAEMPNLGTHVSVQDMDCFQRWANALTTGPQAGTGGTGGTGGGTGGTGGAGVGCDVTPLFVGANGQQPKYLCTIIGACHDAQQSATGLDMSSPGWERKLVGAVASNGTGPSALASMCLAWPEPYLIKGSSPARGLFLEKLAANPPCGVQMPNLGPPLTAADLACVQRWANALTSQ
jgi:hypothetical protein